MLALFRNNSIATVLLLAIATALLRLPALMGWIHPDTVPPDGAGQLYDFLFGKMALIPWVSALVSAILVFLQAILVNWLSAQSRLNPDRNWLPALFYLVAMSCISDLQFLSPALVAATFLPLMYRLLFKVYKSNENTLIIFDVGVLLGFSALFYVPALLLFPIVLLSILHLASVKVREIGVLFAGVFVPGFLGWAVAFSMGQGGMFRKVHLWSLFQFWDFGFVANMAALTQIILLSLLFLIVLISYNTYYYKKLIQVQKYNNLLYWLIFATALLLLLRNVPQTEHAALAGMAAGIFLSLSFQSFKNHLISEVLFLALLGTIYTAMFFFI